jgi:flavodoxin
MKNLVVYYSLEGNTKFIAENIASEIGADLLELKPLSEIKSSGFSKYIWGGRQVVMGSKPKLRDISLDPEGYDTIFIGTPVWAFSFSPAINTFLSRHRIEGKKVALFCCNGGSIGKTFTNMRDRLQGNEILGEIEFAEPIKGVEEKATLAREWAKEMIGL